jgi:hypothetical protein
MKNNAKKAKQGQKTRINYKLKRKEETDSKPLRQDNINTMSQKNIPPKA